MVSSLTGLRGRDGITRRKLGCYIFLVFSIVTTLRYSWKIGVVLVLISIHVFMLVTVLENIRQSPINCPEQFLKWDHTQVIRRPILLCLGDSITNGYVSANYTTEIPSNLKDAIGIEQVKNEKDETKPFKDPIWVVNAGYNYATSHVILHEKLPRMLSIHPDYILIMIGTNDILSMYKKSFKKQIATFNLIFEDVLTMSSFERNINEMISSIRELSPKVEIGVCTIPPLGEDLNTAANMIVQQANKIIINAVSSQRDDKCISIIHVYEEMEKVLLSNQQKKYRIPVDNYVILFTLMSPIYHMFNRGTTTSTLSWNFISSLVGNVLLTDGVHVNERARDIIVGLITQWLQKRHIAKTIVVKSLR